MTNGNWPIGAIVLGTEVNGLAVVRSLGRLGVRVAAVHASPRGDFARHSRYLSHFVTVAPDASDDQIVAAIMECADRLRGPTAVVMPTTDRFSELIARRDGELEQRYRICNPAPATCESFLDKWRTAELCLRHGINIPFTTCPQTDGELEKAAMAVEYPAIVKPRLTFGTGFPGKNAVVRSARELRAFFDAHQVLGRCVVQQIVPSGDGDIFVTASYSSREGRLLAIYSGRKIRQYLPDYGATCFGISERSPDLEASTTSFLDAIAYRGFAALEFARSRQDGRSYFLELNTRTYYHNQLFADAGVDLTQVAYLDSIGQDFRKVLNTERQQDGVIWLDFRRDYQSMRLKRLDGKITILAWLMSLAGARSFAVWSLRDPLPFLSACAGRLKELILRLFSAHRAR